MAADATSVSDAERKGSASNAQQSSVLAVAIPPDPARHVRNAFVERLNAAFTLGAVELAMPPFAMTAKILYIVQDVIRTFAAAMDAWWIALDAK